MSHEKNFLLLSLDDDDAKNIANILSNKSCSKILDLLTKEELTESAIAEKLNLPISTIHYNLQQLLKAKLIDWENYHYSEKGKQVKHYTVANKYIIIAPKGRSANFLDIIKNLIPTTAMITLGGFFIHWFTKTTTMPLARTVAPLDDAVLLSEPIIESTTFVADEVITASSQTIIQSNTSVSFLSQIIAHAWFWFILGAILGVGTYLLANYLRKRFKKKRT